MRNYDYRDYCQALVERDAVRMDMFDELAISTAHYSRCTSTRTVPVLGKCKDSIEYLKESVTNISFVNTNIFLYCFSHYDHEMKNL